MKNSAWFLVKLLLAGALTAGLIRGMQKLQGVWQQAVEEEKREEEAEKAAEAAEEAAEAQREAEREAARAKRPSPLSLSFPTFQWPDISIGSPSGPTTTHSVVAPYCPRDPTPSGTVPAGQPAVVVPPPPPPPPQRPLTPEQKRVLCFQAYEEVRKALGDQAHWEGKANELAKDNSPLGHVTRLLYTRLSLDAKGRAEGNIRKLHALMQTDATGGELPRVLQAVLLAQQQLNVLGKLVSESRRISTPAEQQIRFAKYKQGEVVLQQALTELHRLLATIPQP